MLAWLRENERWNEGPIAELAAGCLATELFERSVTLFDEAIALHVKSAPNRGVGDGVLSRYYRDQAGALSGLLPWGRIRQGLANQISGLAWALRSRC